MILDADERFHRFAPRLVIDDADAVHATGTYDQLAALQALLNPEYDAIVTSRRHWNNFHWDSPCQRWDRISDWQARILRHCDHVQYRADIRMHEQLIDTQTGKSPRWYQPTIENCEVYHDHYHTHFKGMEVEQRLHDIEIYNRIHAGERPPTLKEWLGIPEDAE